MQLLLLYTFVQLGEMLLFQCTQSGIFGGVDGCHEPLHLCSEQGFQLVMRPRPFHTAMNYPMICK